MITTITGEQPFQVLTNNFSISPSNEGYTLQISADGKQYSNLFTVGAGVTRLVTGVAANSYYRLSGNQSKVSVNWMKTCVTEGGGSGTELQPVADFPLNAVEGTVISYTGSSSASGVYQYDGNEWTEVGANIDLSAYWTSAQTQSAITVVEDHLFDVEQVTASALTELHDGLLEVSARTVDMSDYWTSAQTEEAIAQAVEGYATSGDMQSAFTLISETQQVAAAGLNQLEGRIDELSGATPDLSAYYTSAQTEDAISAATAGKADAANVVANNNFQTFARWNSQGIITGPGNTAQDKAFDINGNRFKPLTFETDSWPRIWAPTAAGTAGDILVSTGNGAPVWSAVTGPDMSNYWNSAETKTYVDNRIDGYNTASTITITPTPMTEGYWLYFGDGGDVSAPYGPEFQMFKTNKSNLVVADISWLMNHDYAQPGNGVTLIGFDSADGAYDTQMAINIPSSVSLTPQNFDMDIPFIVSTTRPSSRVILEWDNLSSIGYPNYFIYNTDTKIGHFAYDLSINEFVPGVVKSDGVITKVKKLTQAQYDAIVVKDPNTFYIIVNN